MEGTPSGCVNHIVDHHVARPALALSTDSMHIVSMTLHYGLRATEQRTERSYPASRPLV